MVSKIILSLLLTSSAINYAMDDDDIDRQSPAKKRKTVTTEDLELANQAALDAVVVRLLT